MLLNKQIKTYLSDDRPLKEHQKKTLRLLEEKTSSSKRILDIGCCDGLLIEHLTKKYPDSNIDGVELSQELFDIALKRFEGNKNVKIFNESILDFQPTQKYDIITAEGILSVFDDAIPVLDQWVSWLNPGGILMVFGVFCPEDMDFRVSYKNRYNDQGWENGFTQYSVNTISQHLKKKNLDHEFQVFETSVNIPKGEDPIKSYSERVGNQEKFILANTLILNLYHLTVKA